MDGRQKRGCRQNVSQGNGCGQTVSQEKESRQSVSQKKESPQSSGIVLSQRLRMLEAMVTPGNRLVDVGCDHGFLAIDLVKRNICPGAVATDVRRGPLAGAEAHVKEFGLGDYIETRLSDGLAACAAEEADTLVCAGMGGRLMERILTEGMEKAKRMRELILQPQSELPRFRAFLRNAGFRVTEEDAVFEDGKYYFAMKAVYGACECPTRVSMREYSSMPECAGTSECSSMPECAGTPGCGNTSMSGEAKGDDGTFGGEKTGDGAGVQDQRLWDMFGRILLQRRHPVLLQYLRQRDIYIRKLEASLNAADSGRAGGRLREVQEEQELIKRALSYYVRAE